MYNGLNMETCLLRVAILFLGNWREECYSKEKGREKGKEEEEEEEREE